MNDRIPPENFSMLRRMETSSHEPQDNSLMDRQSALPGSTAIIGIKLAETRTTNSGYLLISGISNWVIVEENTGVIEVEGLQNLLLVKHNAGKIKLHHGSGNIVQVEEQVVGASVVYDQSKNTVEFCSTASQQPPPKLPEPAGQLMSAFKFSDDAQLDSTTARMESQALSANIPQPRPVSRNIRTSSDTQAQNAASDSDVDRIISPINMFRDQLLPPTMARKPEAANHISQHIDAAPPARPANRTAESLAQSQQLQEHETAAIEWDNLFLSRGSVDNQRQLNGSRLMFDPADFQGPRYDITQVQPDATQRLFNPFDDSDLNEPGASREVDDQVPQDQTSGTRRMALDDESVHNYESNEHSAEDLINESASQLLFLGQRSIPNIQFELGSRRQRLTPPSLLVFDLLRQRSLSRLADPGLTTARTLNQIQMIEIRPPNRDIVETCSICQEDFNKRVDPVCYLDCTHWFHVACVSHWLDKRRSCPSCKGPVSLISRTITRNRDEEMIES